MVGFYWEDRGGEVEVVKRRYVHKMGCKEGNQEHVLQLVFRNHKKGKW